MVDFSGTSYWFISNRAGDSSYNLAMMTANAACPDGNIVTKNFFSILTQMTRALLTFSDNTVFLVKTGQGDSDYSTTPDIVVTSI